MVADSNCAREAGETRAEYPTFPTSDDGFNRLLDVIEATRLIHDLAEPMCVNRRARVDLRAEGVMALMAILGREMELAYGELSAAKS